MPIFNTPNFEGLPIIYENEWRLALQQTEARVRPYINMVPVNGAYARFRTLQSTEAREMAYRLGDTNPEELDSELRSLFVNFYKSALIADANELIQLGRLGNPLSRYMETQMAARARNFDTTIINGILGPVLTGTNNNVSVPLPTTQDIVVNYAFSGAGTNTGLTLDKIQAGVEKLAIANVTGYGIENYSDITILLSPRQMNDLMHENKIINHDFNANRPLVNGYVGTYYGVNFVIVDRNALPYNAATDVRTCVMFARRSVVAGMALENEFHMDRLPTKDYNYQLFAKWGWGATRLDEEGVIRIFCDESP